MQNSLPSLLCRTSGICFACSLAVIFADILQCICDYVFDAQDGLCDAQDGLCDAQDGLCSDATYLQWQFSCVELFRTQV